MLPDTEEPINGDSAADTAEEAPADTSAEEE